MTVMKKSVTTDGKMRAMKRVSKLIIDHPLVRCTVQYECTGKGMEFSRHLYKMTSTAYLLLVGFCFSSLFIPNTKNY
jgi:hypothetical protein